MLRESKLGKGPTQGKSLLVAGKFCAPQGSRDRLQEAASLCTVLACEKLHKRFAHQMIEHAAKKS